MNYFLTLMTGIVFGVGLMGAGMANCRVPYEREAWCKYHCETKDKDYEYHGDRCFCANEDGTLTKNDPDMKKGKK